MNRPKWEISVRAGSYYPSLAINFCMQDIELCCENDELGMQFFAHSDHIEELTEPQSVSRRLYSLQLLLNGALRVSSGKPYSMPIEFVEFASHLRGGLRTVNPDGIEDCPFSTDPKINLIEPTWRKLKSSDPAYLLHISKTDSDFRQLLFLAGLITANSPVEKILTWGTLYKMLDCVKHISKLYSLDFKSFADGKSIERFTAACNSMSTLGIFARHGSSSHPAPTRVLTDLQEAIELILSLSHHCASAYIQKQYP